MLIETSPNEFQGHDHLSSKIRPAFSRRLKVSCPLTDVFPDLLGWNRRFQSSGLYSGNNKAQWRLIDQCGEVRGTIGWNLSGSQRKD